MVSECVGGSSAWRKACGGYEVVTWLDSTGYVVVAMCGAGAFAVTSPTVRVYPVLDTLDLGLKIYRVLVSPFVLPLLLKLFLVRCLTLTLSY